MPNNIKSYTQKNFCLFFEVNLIITLPLHRFGASKKSALIISGFPLRLMPEKTTFREENHCLRTVPDSIN